MMKKIKTKYRIIQTEIPHPKDLELMKKNYKYEVHPPNYQLPVVWDKAKDFQIYDRWGNKFIDFTSGICVANVGHSNDEIKRILQELIFTDQIYAYNFPTEIRAVFIEELIRTLPDFCEKVFLLSSGTEATECALKLMKLYGKTKDKSIIVSFYGSMHGRTMGAKFMMGKGNIYGSLIPEIVHLPFPYKDDKFYPDAEQWLINNTPYKKIAGFMIESYQGWSARFYPKKYIQDLVRFARKHEALVCFDEIQAGFGRTGKMFAYQHYNVEPDLICVGKGFSSGLPLSGVIGRKEVLELGGEDLSSTFTASSLSCGAGLINLKELQRITGLPYGKKVDFHEKELILQRFLRKHIKKYEVNGKGLIAGIITDTEKEATRICWEAMKRGLLLILTHRNSVKIAPPLTIPKEALQEALQVLKEVIK